MSVISVLPGGLSSRMKRLFLVVTSNKEETQPVKVVPCPKCLQENTGPGIPHPCGPSTRKENFANMIVKEGKGAEQVAASLVSHIR